MSYAADPAPACQFTAPDAWRRYTVQWEGPCVGGVADGLGVLRAYQKKRPVQVFYGRLKAGSLAVGVIDTPDGYLAGKFEAGHVVKDEDRNTLIGAFREGSAAARAASESFKRKGNAASARHYQQVAEKLASQMD